jgi:hypothetical protein
MMLLSGLRAEDPREGGLRRRWYVLIAGVLVLGFGLLVNQILVDQQADDLGHSINGFFRNFGNDPTRFHHAPLANGRQEITFELTKTPGSYVCHFQADAAGSRDPQVPVTCARP